MKLFLAYIRGKMGTLLVFLAFCGVFCASFSLYHLPVAAVLYPAALCLGIGCVVCWADFARVRREHEAMGRIKTVTDAMTAAFPENRSPREEDYREIIRRLCEEHGAFRQETDRRYRDMVEYYTVWAHQIKTPIAAMGLRLQSEDSPLSRKLSGELRRIEQYVQMVLTFLRLGSDSTDYVFREYELDAIVKGAVKRFSADFIDRRLTLVYSPLNTRVVTDEKWLSFVIEQVLSNALKYTPAGSVTISMAGEQTLRVQDTGIGIAPEDLPRIFENGYTGYNGRTDRKASGIGLYLCRRICDNLGHTITARSTVDVGTAIDIDLSRKRTEIE